MSIGNLVVSLGLDAQDFISGMTKSEAQAKKFSESIGHNIEAAVVKAELAVEGLKEGVKLAVEAFKELTKGAGEFKDLEQSVGSSAESIAGLAVAASMAGVAMDDIATASNKLTKNLVGVDDESQAAGAALKAIGINIKEFKQLDPVSQYKAIGKALEEFADGSGKVAVAQALLGKGGAEQLRVFKALEEAGGAQVILTQKQIEVSNSYTSRQAKARTELTLYAQAAASEAIPALMDLTKAGTDFLKTLLGVDETTKKISANSAVREFAEDGAYAFAVLTESVVGFIKAMRAIGGSFESVYADIKLLKTIGEAALPNNAADLANGVSEAKIKAALEERNKTAAEANQRYIDLWTYDGTRFSRAIKEAQNARRQGLTGERFNAFNDPRSTLFGVHKEQLDFNGADTNGAARRKKELDGEIKAIRDYAKQQQDAFDFANKYVKGEYDEGVVNLQDYFKEQHRIRDAGLAAELEALDKEQEALEAARPKAKDADRIDIDNKIAEVVAKRADAVAKASRDGILAAQQESVATRQLRDSYDDLRASIMSLGGDTAGASAIKIAQQVAAARRLIAQAGGDSSQVNRYADLLTKTEELGQAQKDYAVLVEHSRNAEDELLLSAKQQGLSEIDTLRAVGAVRQDALEQMAKMVEEAQQLAIALGTPEAIQYAERLGLAFKKAAAEVDPLLQKIRSVGEEMGESISKGFEDAIVEGKGLRETLKGIEQDLIRIIARTLVTKPLGDFFSNLLGGTGESGGGGGLLGSFFGWAFGGSSSSSLPGVTAPPSSGEFGLGGGMAIGGPTLPNMLHQVGERRPEIYDDGSRQWLLTGSRRGRIIPNPTFGGSNTTVHAPITLVMPENTTRQTATQAASTIAQRLNRALARNR